MTGGHLPVSPLLRARGFRDTASPGFFPLAQLPTDHMDLAESYRLLQGIFVAQERFLLASPVSGAISQSVRDCCCPANLRHLIGCLRACWRSSSS